MRVTCSLTSYALPAVRNAARHVMRTWGTWGTMHTLLEGAQIGAHAHSCALRTEVHSAVWCRVAVAVHAWHCARGEGGWRMKTQKP